MLGAVVAVALNLLFTGTLTLFFDLVFVVVCVAAALCVRPREFFGVGVLPPLLMLGIVLALALVARPAVAEEGDGLVQAVVSGLAHRAGGLVTGYGLTLAILAVRQLVLRGSVRRLPSRPRACPDAARVAARR